MDVIRDKAIVSLRENNVKVLTRELTATTDRFEVGEVTRTDVSQARARRALSVSDLDACSGPVKVCSCPLRARSLETALVDWLNHGFLGTFSRRRLTRRSRSVSTRTQLVIAALYREQAARHDVDIERGELLPSVRSNS